MVGRRIVWMETRSASTRRDRLVGSPRRTLSPMDRRTPRIFLAVAVEAAALRPSHDSGRRPFGRSALAKQTARYARWRRCTHRLRDHHFPRAYHRGDIARCEHRGGGRRSGHSARTWVRVFAQWRGGARRFAQTRHRALHNVCSRCRHPLCEREPHDRDR